MKLALLGPNGQLGSDLAKAAAAEAVEVIAVPRGQLDVTDADAVARVLGAARFDVLVNCTGYHKTDEVEANAGLAIAVNAHAVRDLAHLCAAKGARLIHISTDYVFGGEPRTVPYRETDPPRPVNVYGASKALGEELAAAAGGHLTVLRVASLFGVTGASGKGGNFVETIIRAGTERGELSVVDDQTMSPTATADVAGAILALLGADAGPGIYHVVNSGPASWFEFAAEIVRQAGVRATVNPVATAKRPTVARRPAYSVLDNAKVSAAIGPMRHWREALADYLRAKGHTTASAGRA
jgi:dTDP-4-dehydrorhamnose reductase